MGGKTRPLLCGLLVLIANIAIAAKLFGVEYSAYHGSIESTFIAMARIQAKYLGQWSWWPFWNGGLPLETVYLPFTHWLVAAFTLLSGLSAARSFHIVSAGIYVLSAVALFWMALELSGKLLVSLFAALAYSSISLSALMIPVITTDAGGALNLRRLQDLVVYGEAPHSAALALLLVAMVCFSRALVRRSVTYTILAGVMSATVVLSNAFGIVDLVIALACWLMAFPIAKWWARPLRALAILTVTYSWISPWFSPTMVRAIRANSFTVGGDFRYRFATWAALAAVGAAFLLLWLAMRRFKASSSLQFFVLFGYVPTAIVMTSRLWDIPLVPQPARYELEMDMALLLAIVFAGAALVNRLPSRARMVVAGICIAGLTAQLIHAVVYARGLIRGVELSSLGEVRIAKWLDQNRPGQRAFISSSACFMYNMFTDNPQLTGGHDQHTVNRFIPIVSFVIYTGMNAGDRDAAISILWLKAFGVHQISVSGPESSNEYNTMVHPRKFDGVLPLLWRDHGDAIYEVPSRSLSLAHVIPREAVVKRVPENGLDTAPSEAYVAALDDPAYSPASFEWKNLSEADIRTNVDPGRVIAVQVTYERGWEAWAGGRPQKVIGDALGQMVIEPDCKGPCEVSLRYTGGTERVVTRAMSLSALLLGLGYGVTAGVSSRRRS